MRPRKPLDGDRALAVQDSGDPVGRDLESPAELRRAHAKFLELLGDVLAWMDSAACHAFRR